MDILKFKLPLKVYLPKPVKLEEIDLNSIDPKEIEALDGQYDWIEAWCSDESYRKYLGFCSKDVQMEVIYDKGNYIITLISDKPFNTIVKNNRYCSSTGPWEDVTLREAVKRYIEGCVWDGIGENEIGEVSFQDYKTDVWMDCSGLTEIV